MKAIALFPRTTVVGGVFFLAPIVVVIVAFAKAFACAKTGLNAVCCSHSSGFGLERRRGDGAFDCPARAGLPSCRARRAYPDRAALRQRIGVLGAVEVSGLRIPETPARSDDADFPPFLPYRCRSFIPARRRMGPTRRSTELMIGMLIV
jgi:hypothetical protein